MRRIALLALVLAGCHPLQECGCARRRSPVGADETVRIQGTTDAPSVRMYDTLDGTERVATTPAFEFAWVGRDLNNAAGEREFILRAPANPEPLAPLTRTEPFPLRKDVELPPMRIWTAVPELSIEEGGLRVRFTPPDFAKMERYELALEYNKSEEESATVEVGIGSGNELVPIARLNARMTGRGLAGVLVSVRAVTAPSPIRVIYQSPAVDLNIPYE